MEQDPGVTSDMRVRALSICRNFLGGKWSKLAPEDFKIDRIHGGLSNMMYLCARTNTKHDDENEETIPDQVILRMYGQIIQENPETVVTDSVIFSLLAEKKLGPKLFGVFTGGRVEEYVKSRHLYTRELANPDISIDCAKIMADFHKLSMPLGKEPVWLIESITRYLDDALNNISFDSDDVETRRKLQTVFSFNLASEFRYLKMIIAHCVSPVVFCHNDLQEGNILLSKDDSAKGWQLKPIDFEYSSYNYRGFDIANHFCEWCYDYSEDKPPYYKANQDDFPSAEQQKRFFKSYLSAIAPSNISSNKLGSVEEEIESLLLEVEVFTLVSDFFWALWSLVQAEISSIKFNYLDYAMVRFGAYYQNKQKLFKDYPEFASL